MTSSTWRQFLTQQGAVWDERGVAHFSSHPHLEDSSPTLVDLSHWGVLWVKGPDTHKFLQGQLTCDLKQLESNTCLRGAHCNVKGRAIFTAYVFDGGLDETCVGLFMPTTMLTIAEASLAKFIVFSKAKLSIDDNVVCLGLIHPTADHLDQLSTAIRLSPDKFLVCTQASSAQQLWTQLSAHCQLAGYPAWDLANIRAGLGDVEPPTSDEFIPQYLNFHLTGGISFKKGCYIGQEVVARLEYKGKLKRHLQRVGLQHSSAPQIGDQLSDGISDQSIGNIVACAQTGPDSFEILAVINDQAANDNQVFLKQEKNVQLQVLSLPYAITK